MVPATLKSTMAETITPTKYWISKVYSRPVERNWNWTPCRYWITLW